MGRRPLGAGAPEDEPSERVYFAVSNALPVLLALGAGLTLALSPGLAPEGFDGHLIKPYSAGELMATLMRDLEARHAIVGATRSIGLFGIVELVKDKKSREPLAPFNGTSEPMARLGRFFRDQGLYTFVRWNTFFTNPPLCISEEELGQGFDVIDRGLTEIEQG